MISIITEGYRYLIGNTIDNITTICNPYQLLFVINFISDVDLIYLYLGWYTVYEQDNL